jgi:aerobic-type carbon monoxide dehydrogenase small subunit (CoxS/CutS family)
MKINVNGASHEVDAAPDTPLVFVLRNQLGLTGTKYGCGAEQCGACAVLVDGTAVLSCVRAVSEFAESDIVTVEGLAHNNVQRAFIAHNAAQCGYCTPGIVIAATALLNRNPKADKSGIRAALEGHLCRCGSQPRILKAIEQLVSDGL